MSFPAIEVLYEDNHLLVVVKPCNIPSQADITGDPDMLSLLKSDLKRRYNKPGNVFLGLVHRLDRPVGGVMVFAKTSKSAARLSQQIRERTFQKTYLSVLNGALEQPEGTLVHYLKKDSATGNVFVVPPNSKGAQEAILDYHLCCSSGSLSLVNVELHTGRSHQIRVQFAAIGHPLFGDQRYGEAINKPGQQIALWSHKIQCQHPTREEILSFCFDPPFHQQPWSFFKKY